MSGVLSILGAALGRGGLRPPRKAWVPGNRA
jgi:hypothetical protein